MGSSWNLSLKYKIGGLKCKIGDLEWEVKRGPGCLAGGRGSCLVARKL